jgi:mediator of RNA polymerase II transcription subunit 23
MKSGCIDFLDFVDKLASRVTNSDQQILRSNHVTWLLAQIIRIEIVMNTLSSDPRKVIYICMTICKKYSFFMSVNC